MQRLRSRSIKGSARSTGRSWYAGGTGSSAKPRSSAKTRTSHTSLLLQVWHPVVRPVFSASGRYCSQSSRRPQTKHALGCSSIMSARMSRRRFFRASVSVLTTIASATGVVHEVGYPRKPSTSTTHSRHAPNGDKDECVHRCGMDMLCRNAHSRIVSPCLALTVFPSIVSFTLTHS